MDQILDACKDFGKPFYFQYHHGLIIRVNVDSVTSGELGNIECRLNGQLVLDLSSGYLEVVPTCRPGNLVTDLKECLKIRQKESGEVLGWLCWPRGPESEKSVKTTHVSHSKSVETGLSLPEYAWVSLWA